MIHDFQSTFQVAHDKRGIGFKGPKLITLEEHFANLNIHDQTWDIDGIGLYFAPSSLAHSDCSISHDFFNDPSSNMIIFINMVLLYKIDPFFFPPYDDPLLATEFTNSSTSSLGACPSRDVYSPPHSPLGEVPYLDLILSIYDLSRNDHSYLLILK